VNFLDLATGEITASGRFEDHGQPLLELRFPAFIEYVPGRSSWEGLLFYIAFSNRIQRPDRLNDSTVPIISQYYGPNSMSRCGLLRPLQINDPSSTRRNTWRLTCYHSSSAHHLTIRITILNPKVRRQPDRARLFYVYSFSLHRPNLFAGA